MNLSSTLTTTESELYRLLEKAKLVQYFPNFLVKGGDDVSQLSESSKEEFDEIIELVGMKQRPLHIRRLQKALKEYSDNRDMFIYDDKDSSINVPESWWPYLTINQAHLTPSPSRITGPNITKTKHDGNVTNNNNNDDDFKLTGNAFLNHSLFPMPDSNDSSSHNLMGLFNNSLFNPASSSNIATSLSNGAPIVNNSSAGSNMNVAVSMINQRLKPLLDTMSTAVQNTNTSNNPSFKPNMASLVTSNSAGIGIPVSLLPNAVLSELEKSKIQIAAENLAVTLPKIDARTTSSGRKDVNKGVLVSICNVLLMSKDDPERRSEIYKYSAIYGRFNAPRRTGKPMNHHEVSVNEAAAQLCLQIPELITRRDNLFHLARQVVKMAEEIQSSDLNTSSSSNNKNSVSMVPTETKLNSACDCPMLKQIQLVKQDIENLLAQERQIRESYREAKLANQNLLMNELHKRLDDILQQLNNKFTEQTSLATRQFCSSKKPLASVNGGMGDGCDKCNTNSYTNNIHNHQSLAAFQDSSENIYDDGLLSGTAKKPSFPEPESYQSNSFIDTKTEPTLIQFPPQPSSISTNSFIDNIYNDNPSTNQSSNREFTLNDLGGPLSSEGSMAASLDCESSTNSYVQKTNVYSNL